MVDAVGATIYGYTSAGLLQSEDGPWANDTVNYLYNNRLRTSLPLQAPNATSWSQSYGYDAARRLQTLTSPAGAFNYTLDQLGSVREMFDSTGAVRARYDYDPYGRRTKLSGDLDANFGFTGYYVHAPTGLYLTLYRAYDSEAGRLPNRDPIGEFGGLNLYGYARNNPLRYLDTYGLASGDWWDPRSYFNDAWLRYYHTGDPNASDEVYDAATEAAGSYIHWHSPLRGAIGYAGVQTPHGAGLHGEAIGVAGWDVDSGGWGGGVVAGGAGQFSYGADKVHGSPAWPIGLVDSSTLPIGGFITEGPTGVEVGLYLPRRCHSTLSPKGKNSLNSAIDVAPLPDIVAPVSGREKQFSITRLASNATFCQIQLLCKGFYQLNPESPWSACWLV